MDLGLRTIASNCPFSIVRSSALNRSFFNDHHRYVVADRIDQATFSVLTCKRGLLVVDLHLGSALWAAKYFKQFRANWHKRSPVRSSYYERYWKQKGQEARCSCPSACFYQTALFGGGFGLCTAFLAEFGPGRKLCLAAGTFGFLL